MSDIRKKKRETVTELIQRLESDPEWVARRDRREAEREAIMERYRIAAQPIRQDLAAAGFDVESEWDFVNTKDRYDGALPVLMKHFRMDYPNVIREGLARSFARPWARDIAWDQALAAYLSEPNKEDIAPPGEFGAPSGAKDGLAIALSAMARPSDLDILIELISNPENGPSRIFFVQNLSRSKSLKAFETLVRLSNDGDLRKEIAVRLKSKLRRQAKKVGANSAKQ